MLIGLGHHAQVGKDCVAEILERTKGYRRISFAAKLKDLALALNPDLIPSVASNVRQGEGRLRTLVVRYGWDDAKKRFPVVRTYLQELGVACRDTFGEGFWVHEALYADSFVPTETVISDVRFRNEADAIKDLGGVVVKVTRPGFGAVNDHVSEHDLDDYEFDYVLENSGTLEDLEYFVGRMLERLSDAGRVPA